MACQSRGRIQTKFNGGLFTQPLRYGGKPRMVATQRRGQDLDQSRGRSPLGAALHLSEPAAALLAAADERRRRPDAAVLRLLLEPAAVRKAITKAWFGHEGAYYRENIEPTGGERDCGRTGKPLKTKPGENKGKGYYHSYYFTCGLETVAMMIEYVKYSGDETFRDDGPGPLCPRGAAVLRQALSARCRRQAPPRSGHGAGNLVDCGESRARCGRPAALPR